MQNGRARKSVMLTGCGFVADLYMRSFASFPDIVPLGAYDRQPERLAAFCRQWNIPPFATLEDAFAAADEKTVFLNLTNPAEHYAMNRAILEAGFACWSEKPLAMAMPEAEALHALAEKKRLMLASAPCSVLGEAAQTLGHALRHDLAGQPRLIYAELDDGFIPQAPLEKWHSESGAPWHYQDEFRTGCTLEHAGYYLSWLIAFFGPVESVTAASATTQPDKRGVSDCAPDFSTATLFFKDGIVARLTCSITASHDHRIRVFTDKGVLELDRAWDNSAPLRFRRRFALRRRLVESPFRTRLRLKGPTHPKVGRRGAASMNFALGPAEMLAALHEGRPCRLTADFALHLNEVTLAIQSAGQWGGAKKMQTSCAPMEPMPWAV